MNFKQLNVLCGIRWCRQREELLYQLKVVQSPPASGRVADTPWILVDSDGEEVSEG